MNYDRDAVGFVRQRPAQVYGMREERFAGRKVGWFVKFEKFWNHSAITATVDDEFCPDL
jgi:hypothetical protein